MKRNVPLLFLLPSVLVMLGIAVYPVGFGLWASFHQWNWAIGQADNWFFNGLDNYLRLFKDSAFRNAIWVTLYFTVLAVIVELVVGLGIALLLSRNIRGSWFFRSAVVFPLMVSDIVAAVIFSTSSRTASPHRAEPPRLSLRTSPTASRPNGTRNTWPPGTGSSTREQRRWAAAPPTMP